MKFLADRTTGKLARKLRALGLDVVYWGAGATDSAVQRAVEEGRILLTRSRRVPEERSDRGIMILEANDPKEQVREVLFRLKLKPPEGQFFSRCLMCNEILLPVGKEDVEGKVPDFIYRSYDDFHACPRCRRVYWPGTHLQRMKKEIARTLGREYGELQVGP